MSDKEVREIIIDTVPPSDVQPAELIPPKNLLDAEAVYHITNLSHTKNMLHKMELLAEQIAHTAHKGKYSLYANVPFSKNYNGVQILRDKGYTVNVKTEQVDKHSAFCLISWTPKEPRGN